MKNYRINHLVLEISEDDLIRLELKNKAIDNKALIKILDDEIMAKVGIIEYNYLESINNNMIVYVSYYVII